MFFGWYLDLVFVSNMTIPPPLKIDTSWVLVSVTGLGLVAFGPEKMAKVLAFNGERK